MELPTPKNADTPKEKKHREQVIVVGTLVLVILTFVLVMRRGQGSSGVPTNDSSGFTPGDVGTGSQGADMLPAMIGAIPGQVSALDQGRNAKLNARLRRQSKRLRQQSARLRQINRRENRELARLRDIERRLPSAHSHPKHPGHSIPTTHHSSSKAHGEHWTSRKPHHPPQHHATPQHVTFKFGDVYSHTV